MWVTISIYLTVIGWAYAIGSLLTLIQDRAFRNALALQRFTRKVRRLREPFLLIAGYGQTGELLGKSFDALGQQFVVIDESADRIDSLDLVAYHADIPGLVGDVRNPHHLGGRRPGPPVLRRGAGVDQRRRGQPGGHHGGGAAAPGAAGDRPHRLAGDRRPDGGLRNAVGGQPVRPVRRPPAAGAAGAGVLPAVDLAGERPGRGAAASAASRRPRSLGALRLRPVRPGADRRPAGRGPRGDHHRTDRHGRARTRRSSSATAPNPR